MPRYAAGDMSIVGQLSQDSRCTTIVKVTQTNKPFLGLAASSENPTFADFNMLSSKVKFMDEEADERHASVRSS